MTEGTMTVQDCLKEFVGMISVASSHSDKKLQPKAEIDEEWELYEELEVPEFVREKIDKIPMVKKLKLLTLVSIAVNGVPGTAPGVEIAEAIIEELAGDARSQWMAFYMEDDGVVLVALGAPDWYVIPAAIMELMLNANEQIDGLEYEQVGYLVMSAIPEQDRLDFARAKTLEGELCQDIVDALGFGALAGFKTEASVRRVKFWKEIEQKLLGQS